MAQARFTARLTAALAELASGYGIATLPCRSGSLFTPVYRNARFEWLKVMDSDGLVTAVRRVHHVAGEGAAPEGETSLTLGVVVQSEDATAQTKPNPLGKASLSHIPNGVWVDLVHQGRVRLDRVLIVFVLPKGAAPSHRKSFAIAAHNVANAARIMPDAVTVPVERGASSTRIATTLVREIRPFLVGRGRPRSEA